MKRFMITGAGALVAIMAIAAVAPSARHHASSTGERVWQPTADQDMYDLSPDGKLVAYIDWSTGNLMVHDLVTGGDRDVTKKGTYKQNPNEAESGVFSRDGRMIAYEWWEKKGRQDALRVIGIDGSGMKEFYRKPGVGVWPLSFSANGGVLTILDSTKTRTLAIVPPSGPPKVIKVLGAMNRNLTAVLSPDENYLAYTEPGVDFKRNIVIIATADGKEITRLRNPADDAPERWMKDGSLVFTSDRNGAPGLWSQPMSAGKPAGAAKLIRGDPWRLAGVKVTDDGRLFTDVQSGDRDVFTIPFDANATAQTGQRLSASGKPGERYSNAQFSPDGKYVVFMKRERDGLQYNKLVIRSLSSDETREFLPRVFAPLRPHWIPGQQALTLQGNDKDNQPNIYRFDLRAGESTLLVANTASPVAFSPDGKTMYYSPFIPGDSALRRMVAFDMATRRERVIYTAPANTYIPAHSVSRDGKTLVAMSSEFAHGRIGGDPRGVIAISTLNGAAHSLTSGIPYDSTKQHVRAIGFTSDQRSFVVMVVGTGDDNTLSLWRVPLAGGAGVPIGHAPDGLELNGAGSATSWLNPAGTRMVYVAGSIGRELWLNDDPALRSQLSSRR
jgi:Tol biopolymer transport system component